MFYLKNLQIIQRINTLKYFVLAERSLVFSPAFGTCCGFGFLSVLPLTVFVPAFIWLT